MYKEKWMYNIDYSNITSSITYKNIETSNTITHTFPTVNSDFSFTKAGTSYVCLPRLLKPLVTEEEYESVNINFLNEEIMFKDTIYKSTNKTIYLLDKDIELLNVTYGLNIDKYVINDTVLDGIDLSYIIGNGYIEMFRVVTIMDDLKIAIEELSYENTIDISDINRRINQIFRSKYIRLDSDNPIAKEVIRNKIILPDVDFNNVYFPIYKYYIDTLSTPQSGMSGKIACLCKGAKIEKNTLIKGTSIFSEHLTSVLTFPENIKETRLVIVSATVSQSVPLKEPELPSVRTKDYNKNIQGINLYSAMMDYFETSNDGVILSESASKKLVSSEKTTWRFIIPKTNFDIMVNESDVIAPSTPIIRYISKDINLIYSKNKTKAIIDKIETSEMFYQHRDSIMIIISVTEEYDLIPGSKIAGLHSNKHIVSRILPDNQMPVGEFGNVDMIVSPSTVGKRNNISFIMESIMGHVAKNTKKGFIEQEPFSMLGVEGAIQKLLTSNIPYKVNNKCQFKLKINDNYIKNEIFVGYVFITRLEHHAEKKLTFSNKLQLSENGLPIRGNGMQFMNLNEIEVIEARGNEEFINNLKKEKHNNTRSYDVYQEVYNAWKSF